MAKYDGSITIDSRIDTKGVTKGIDTIKGTVHKLGAAVIAAFSVKAIGQFVKETVNATTELSNAMTGLESILNGQGRSFSKAKSFIEEYVSDGLLSATEAITSYKNLSLRGYNDEQIKSVMIALKDSATFGRQSSYTLGQAVMTASEGLKNENSILVDNAGVTKNVAKMWQDYAKSIGKTTNNLTQQEKIQAEVNGILEETKFQAGDAELYLNTYSGQLARLNASFLTLKQTVGNVFIPIFQAILPILNSVVAGLTKVAQVFASVIQLIFGKIVVDTSKKIASNTNTAADGISNMGNAAEKAGKQAKGALAPFDELNVLSDNSSSSNGSSGGGAGSGNIDFGELETGKTELGVIDAQIEAMAKSIMKWIEPLQNISFDNLSKSLKGLWESIKPLTKTIWDGLYWAWTNLLVPLTKWTIEDLLPSFLNLLSGALKILNPIIKGFMSVGKWLWDSFLKPIAKWTGNLIIKGLEGLAKALTKIGNWMSKNQRIVNATTVAIIAFFAAWKVTELMGFIQMSGGLVTVLKKTGDAIKACTLLKVKDKAETMYLTALYAKDFIVSLGKTIIELGKNAAAWIANTAAQLAAKVSAMSFNPIILAQAAAAKVAEAAQWLWNAALSANPIALVVIAVTALIAAITALIIWTNKESEAEKQLLEDTKAQAEATKQLRDEYDNLQQQKQDKVASDLAEIANTERLYTELQNLVDVNGKVLEGNQTRVEFILNQLNSAMGTEYKLVGDQIQGYNDLTTSIRKNIENKKAQILLEAEEETYKQALIKSTETEMERAKAKLEMDEAQLKFEQDKNRKNAELYLAAKERFDNLDYLSNQYNADIQRYENASMAVLEGNNTKAIELLNKKNASFLTATDVVGKSAEEQKGILGEQYAASLTALKDYSEKHKLGVEGFTADGVKEAENYAKKAKEEYSKVGGYIVDGTIEGVNGKKWNLNRTITNLYNLVPDWAKDVLGIKSPSKVFEEIAEYTDEGFEKGIVNGKKDVLNSIKEMMLGATDTAEKNANIFDINPVDIFIDSLDRLINKFAELKMMTQSITNSLNNVFKLRTSNILIPSMATGSVQPYTQKSIASKTVIEEEKTTSMIKAIKEALREENSSNKTTYNRVVILEPIGSSEFARFTIKSINNEQEAAGKTLLKI